MQSLLVQPINVKINSSCICCRNLTSQNKSLHHAIFFCLFQDFMKTPASAKQVKRAGSFNKNKDSNKDDTSKSSEEEEKGVCDSTESEKDREIRMQNKNAETTEISRSSSPEQFGSRYESGSEESVEEVRRRNVVVTSDVEHRLTSLALSGVVDSSATQQPVKKLSNELCHYATTRKASNSEFDKTSNFVESEMRKTSHEVNRYSRKTSSSDYEIESSLSSLRKLSNEMSRYSSRKTSNTDFDKIDVETKREDFSMQRYTRKTSTNDVTTATLNGHDACDYVSSKNIDYRRHSAPGTKLQNSFCRSCWIHKFVGGRIRWEKLSFVIPIP